MRSNLEFATDVEWKKSYRSTSILGVIICDFMKYEFEWLEELMTLLFLYKVRMNIPFIHCQLRRSPPAVLRNTCPGGVGWFAFINSNAECGVIFDLSFDQNRFGCPHAACKKYDCWLKVFKYS